MQKTLVILFQKEKILSKNNSYFWKCDFSRQFLNSRITEWFEIDLSVP